MSATLDNAFLPHLARLTEVRDLATGIKLFRCQPLESHVRFRYAPGQFGFLSAVAFVLSMIADFSALPAALWILFRERPDEPAEGP